MEESSRGSHVSLMIEGADMKEFKNKLTDHGVQADIRKFTND